MKETVQKSFEILKRNMIFINPLLVYLLFVMTAMVLVVHKNIYIIPRIISVIAIVLLSIAFTAGWFYINKLAVLEYNKDESKEEAVIKSIGHLKKFFEGVGKDFLKMLGTYFITVMLFCFSIFVVTKLLTISIGIPKLIYEIPKLTNISTNTEIINFLNSAPPKDMFVFSNWVLVFYILLSALNYFGVLYISVSSFEKDNFLISFLKSVKFFFNNIFSSILVMLIMFILYIGLNLMSMIMGNSPVAFCIFIILFTIYLNYYVLLVLCLYYDKTKTDSDNGPVCVGED